MTYSREHCETEVVETVRLLSKQYPEIINDLEKKRINLAQYLPKEHLVFSSATNLYDIPDDNTVIMRYMDYDKFRRFFNDVFISIILTYMFLTIAEGMYL